MHIDYSQFLHMIPEVTLMAMLVIVFLADLFTAPKSGVPADRRWFNPLVCVMFVAHILINIFPTEAATTYGGM